MASDVRRLPLSAVLLGRRIELKQPKFQVNFPDALYKCPLLLVIFPDGREKSKWAFLCGRADPGQSRTATLASSLKVANTELQRLAYLDGLTQLPTRMLLADRLEQAIACSRRDGHIIALLFVIWAA